MSATKLVGRTCEACRVGAPPATEAEIAEYSAQIPEWEIVDRNGIPTLERVFRFGDFAAAMAFTNRVGELAEEQGHHPDIYLAWGKVKVTVWTHKIDGLTESDFVFAAKSDQAL